MERRCQYKQRVVRKNRPRERGSSHSCHQVLSISMSELFLTWLPLWSSCLSRMEELQLLVKDQLSQDWTQTPTWNRRLRQWLWTLWTRSLLSLSPLYLRQIMTNYWWVKKRLLMLVSHYFLIYDVFLMWYKTAIWLYFYYCSLLPIFNPVVMATAQHLRSKCIVYLQCTCMTPAVTSYCYY